MPRPKKQGTLQHSAAEVPDCGTTSTNESSDAIAERARVTDSESDGYVVHGVIFNQPFDKTYKDNHDGVDNDDDNVNADDYDYGHDPNQTSHMIDAEIERSGRVGFYKSAFETILRFVFIRRLVSSAFCIPCELSHSRL